MCCYPSKRILRNVITFFIVVALSFESMGQSCSYTTWDFPFPVDADYGWSCGLYLPPQVGGAQTMTQVSMSLYGPVYMNYSYTNQDIYIRHTNEVEYTAANDDYPGTAGFVHVFSGTLDFTSGDGIYTFNFNVNNFTYNGTQTLEVLFINQSGSEYLDGFEFHRTDLASTGPNIGKFGSGGSWGTATSFSSAVQFNLALQFNMMGDICQYPLPVTLKSSNLACKGDDINISWSTASEQNNDYFTIEVSEDGKMWRKIRQINGAGNTNEERIYHEQLSNDFSYYRLSQTDYDGTSTNLNTFASNCSKNSELHVYPNPAHDVVRVFLSEEPLLENIKVVDLKGVTMEIPKSIVGKHKVMLDVNHLKAGVYLLYVKQNEEYITKRITIL